MPKIKKVLITEFGDESKLAIVESDIADPASGQVQVAVEYSIVAGSDVNMRRGLYPFQKKAPLTPGYSVVGKVRVNGNGCSKFHVGDRVACLSKYDGQAELINLHERFLVPVPEGADPKQGVALILDWMTAYEMLNRAANVLSGKKIFVHGLSGGVGSALLALGKLLGAEVFGTASQSKHEELRKLGATPFSYADKNWISAMQQIGGLDAVFDPLGYPSFDESYSILKEGGIVIVYGFNLRGLTKAPPSSVVLPMLQFLSKNLLFWHHKRTKFFGITRTSEYFGPDLTLLFEWLKAGKINVPIKGVFKLSDIQQAHREYHKSAGRGSIILEVNP